MDGQLTPAEWLETQAGPRGIVYGESDCLPVCARWVIHLTGVDPMPQIIGYATTELPYSSRDERDAYVMGLGGMVKAVLRGMAKFPASSPSVAPIGAVGLAEVEQQWTLAIKVAPSAWGTVSDMGVLVIGSDAVRRAWRVGGLA